MVGLFILAGSETFEKQCFIVKLSPFSGHSKILNYFLV